MGYKVKKPTASTTTTTTTTNPSTTIRSTSSTLNSNNNNNNNNNTRRRHTNSKLGCQNCKRKKIRCDENLPQCENCSRGKKETCSYLSLSNNELNRIRITHSLRNTQNKLLNSNYRLPTSSNLIIGNKNKVNKSLKSDYKSKSLIESQSLSQSNIKVNTSLILSDSKDDKINSYDYSKDFEGMENVLEFKFELSSLPLKIPTIMSYPPIQFNNLGINDFVNEFEIIPDDEGCRDHSDNSPNNSMDIDDESTTGSESPNNSSNPLKYGFHKPISFKKLNYNQFTKPKFESNNNNDKVLPDLSFHVVQGSNSLLDHINDYINEKLNDSYDPKSIKLMIDAFICLGQVTILNQMKMINKYSDDIYNDNYIDMMEGKAFERHGITIANIEHELNGFMKLLDDTSNTDLDFKLADEITISIAYANCFITFSNLMLNFSAESYFKSLKKLFQIFDHYSKHLQNNNLKPSPVFHFLINNMQYNMMVINIPSYDPYFIIEYSANIDILGTIYKSSDKQFGNTQQDFYFKQIINQYTNLQTFLKFELLPVIFKLRNEQHVTTYSTSIIFNLLKKWHIIFPTQAMIFKASTIPKVNTIEGLFLKDLTVCLYIYYYSTSTILDSIFPACKYLFSVSFMTPSNSFCDNNKLITTEKNNFYHEINKSTNYYGLSSSELIQRNNYYGSRIYTYFKNRYVFFQNNVIWKNPYRSGIIDENRFNTRKMKNFLEMPIRSFNTTLIRPEHYPTKIHDHYELLLRDPKIYSIFTRSDETMDKKMYTRNIETVDFFNDKVMLQFDYGSKSLLKDYRPQESNQVPVSVELNMNDIRSFYKDRNLIISGESK